MARTGRPWSVSRCFRDRFDGNHFREVVVGEEFVDLTPDFVMHRANGDTEDALTLAKEVDRL